MTQMASKHIAVWPQVRVFTARGPKVLERGDAVPADVSAGDLANLVSFGAITGITAVNATVPTATPTAGSDTVAAVLAAVGEDPVAAAAALEVELGRDSPRTSLTGKLEALIAASSADPAAAGSEPNG